MKLGAIGRRLLDPGVAPRGGAWIETVASGDVAMARASLPVGGRGLKQTEAHNGSCGMLVAPRGGAWIETSPHPCGPSR